MLKKKGRSLVRLLIKHAWTNSLVARHGIEQLTIFVARNLYCVIVHPHVVLCSSKMALSCCWSFVAWDFCDKTRSYQPIIRYMHDKL